MDLSSELQQALGAAYVIQRELSGGGGGRVFLARETALGRDVVIKVRTDDGGSTNGERFLREIAVAARLRHPNIVPVLSSGRAAGLLYYTMPFINGRSLRDVMREEGRLPVDRALQYALEVTDALSYAHGQGIIHRDIKPENILIDSGHAVVTDFGLARAIDAKESAALTHHGIAVGTPMYMSPEQISGEHVVDGRTDIFSLACVIYEMLTGTPPFTGDTMAAILASRFRESTLKLRIARPEVPGRLAAAVEKALATDPENRFNSADRFAAALKQVGGRRDWRLPAAVIGAAAVILVGFLMSRDREPATVVQAATPAPTVSAPVVVTTLADPVPTVTKSSAPKRASTTTTVAEKTPAPARPALAIGSTEDILKYAIDKYNNLEIDAAMENLRNILSPSFLQPVTSEQRNTALLYSGAIYVDYGKPDSARNFFIAAIAYDPFNLPDPQVVTGKARAAYQAARENIFIVDAIGLREHVLKQGEELRPYDFRMVTTQLARVVVSIRSERDSTVNEAIFDGALDGVQVMRWTGQIAGRLIGAGVYELRIQADPVNARFSRATKRFPFRIEQRQDPRSGSAQLVLTPGR